MTIIDRRYSVAEGTAIKAPCRVATTAAITLSGQQTIDGVAVVDGDRVLVKDQASGVDNGIYSCSTGTWTRTKDWDGAYDVVTGTVVYITSGTVNSRYSYIVTTTGTILPGTTSVTLVADRSSAAIAAAATATAAASSASTSATAAAGSATSAAASATAAAAAATQQLASLVLKTRADLVAATVNAAVQFVFVSGYTTVGDGGEEVYARIATPGAVKSYHAQSADGAYWVPTRRVINLKAWGCRINGSTNDTTAFQDAVDYACANSYLLFHPGGSLKISSKITPGNGFYIHGVGPSASEIIANSLTTPLIQSTGGTTERRYFWSVRDIKINNTDRSAVGGIGLDLRNVTDARVDNIWLNNVETGLQLYSDYNSDPSLGCYYNEISKAVITTVKVGIFVSAGANENKIFGSRVADISDSGIVINDGSHNVFYSPAIESFTNYGINISGAAYDTRFDSPRLENNGTGTGIRISSPAVNTTLNSPQYTALATNCSNASLTTAINGLKYFNFTVDRGTIPAHTTDDYSVSLPGFSRDADMAHITPSYNLTGNLMMMAVPSSGAVYSRTLNGGASGIDPVSMTHLITWWKVGGD